MAETLFVIAHAPEWKTGIGRHVGPSSSGVSLCLDGAVSDELLPSGWRVCLPDDVMDSELVRRAFLEFLDSWPRRASESQTSLDERLTIDGRYSVWWTRVASQRQPDHGAFRYFRVAALVDRAIERYRPEKILLLTKDPIVTRFVMSRGGAAGIPVELAPGCAAPVRVRDVGGVWWWLASTARALTYWLAQVLPAVRCRWARGPARWRASSRPTIVFASKCDGYLTLRNATLSLVNWREISEALRAIDPSIDQVFVPRAFDGIGDTGEPRHRNSLDAGWDASAPLVVREAFVPVRGQAAAVRRQVAASWRLRQIERTRRFQDSFRFAGADMAPVFVPQLRDAVADIVAWSFKTGQLRCALRAAGDVRAAIVTEEMYAWSMPVLAAAAALGIPTVGVQHGNMMPAHLTYRVPRGHVRYAPLPDYFAAFGPYAKEIVTGLGAYPSSKVWIVGAPRLESLVTRRIQKGDARSRLGLPADKRVVVLATQTFPWFREAIRGVLECMRGRPDVVLCIKKHQSPRAMSVEGLRAMAAEVGAADVRIFERDLELLLFAGDVWISASSTTILEATLAGTRSICLNFSGEPDRYPYVEDGASLPARSLAELTHSLSRLLRAEPDPESDARRLAFLTRHAGPTKDGRAARTLAGHVIELCQSPRRAQLKLPAA